MSVLDQRPFPIADASVRRLLQALSSLYVRASDVEIILDEAGLPRGDFRWDLAMAELWPQVLSRAAERNSLRQLLTAIAKREEARGYAELFNKLLEAPGVWYQSPDPFEATFVGPGASFSFIDRTELRIHLRSLVEDYARVLIVNGPRQSGKSHTWRLVSHLAQQNPTFLPVWVNLSDWAGEPAAPADIMMMITSQVGLANPKVDEFAHPDNQARLLANAVLSEVRKSSKPWLLVFDGIDGPRLTAEGMRFIETIAADSANRADIPMRVVLLGYNKLLTTAQWFVPEATRRESIGEIGRAELSKCLIETAKHLNVELDDDGLDEAVNQILVQSGPPPPLGDVSRRLAEAARLMFGGQNRG